MKTLGELCDRYAARLARIIDRHHERHRFPLAWHWAAWAFAAFCAYSIFDCIRFVFGISYAIGVILLVAYLLVVAREALRARD